MKVNLADDITHFTETILEKSTNKKGFFKTNLAGITFQTLNNTFVDVRTWFSNQVAFRIFLCYDNNVSGYSRNVNVAIIERIVQEILF